VNKAYIIDAHMIHITLIFKAATGIFSGLYACFRKFEILWTSNL